MSEPKNPDHWNIRDPEDHYAYIMAHLVDGCIVAPVKIGISKHPEKRLKQVQATMPGRIVLLAKFCFWRRDHALMVEQAFHRTCRLYRVGGEWFDIMPSDAVGLMSENLKGFADDFLGADETGDVFSAYSHMSVPGFDYDYTAPDFGHGKGRQCQ